MKKLVLLFFLTSVLGLLAMPQAKTLGSLDKVKYERTSGVIDSVLENKVSLRIHKSKVKVFYLTTDTLVQRNGVDATVKQIHAGDAVKELRYEKKSKKIQRIEIGS